MAQQDKQESEQEQLGAASGDVQGSARKVQLYDGAELRPFEGRPGAMDAFKLPSRVLEQIIYPKGANK